MNELKDEINELADKLRQTTIEQKKSRRRKVTKRWKIDMKIFLFCFRDNLSKQLELTNVKLKTESLNLNLLQEQCAELEKEKNMMTIEIGALQTDFNAQLSLLESDLNTVSSVDLPVKDEPISLRSSSVIVIISVNMILNKPSKIVTQRQISSNRLSIVRFFDLPLIAENECRCSSLELHDSERQIPELRKKAEDERTKKEAVGRMINESLLSNVSFSPTGGEEIVRDRQ